jgi:hypothetical protein
MEGEIGEGTVAVRESPVKNWRRKSTAGEFDRLSVQNLIKYIAWICTNLPIN